MIKVLLARWMQPATYGAFATAFSISLLFIAFHGALLIEPMLVFGAGKYRANLKPYLGFLFAGHVILTVAASILLAAAAPFVWSAGEPNMARSLLGLAVSMPFVLILVLVRRAFYIRARPDLAALGGAFYFAFTLALLYILVVLHLLTLFSALVTMGVASILSTLLVLRWLNPQFRDLKNASLTLRQVIKEHWNYGRWAISSALLNWLPGNLYFALLLIFVGIQGNAVLQVSVNLIQPIIQLNSAMALVLLPEMARHFRQPDKTTFQRLVGLPLGIFVLGSVAYWLFLTLFRQPIIHHLYNGRYDDHADLLIIAGLLPISAAANSILSTAIRALEYPSIIFWSSLIATIVTFVIGIFLTAIGGVAGALWGYVIASVVGATIIGWWFLRVRHRGAQQ